MQSYLVSLIHGSLAVEYRRADGRGRDN